MNRIKLIFFFCFFFIGLINAQDPVFHNYTVKDGLPSLETYDIISDSKGFLWIASDGGISRFDGYTFKSFSVKNGLPEGAIFKLYEDYKGRIWFSSINSRVGYIFNDSVFVLAPTFRKPTDTPNASFIASFYVDKQGTLWLGTAHSALLYKIAPPYVNVKPVVTEIKSDYSIQFDKDASVVFGNGYFSFARSNDSIYLNGYKTPSGIKFDTLRFPQKKIDPYNKAFVKYNNSVSFLGAGRSIYKMEKNRIVPFATIDHDIDFLFVDKTGFLWAGELLGGIHCFKSPLKNNSNQHLFPDFTITSVITDFEDGYWFTTLEKGVLYVPGLNFINLSSQNRFAEKQFNSIALLPSGAIAAQSYLGPLYISEKDSFREINNTGISLFTFPEKPGMLFYTGVSNTGYWGSRQYNTSPHLFSFHQTGINYFFKNYQVGKDSQLYANGINDFYEINEKNESARMLVHFNERINSFVIDTDETFWFATSAGLYSYKKNTMPFYYGDSFPILTKNMDHLIMDRSGKLWMNTKGNGILVFDKKKKVTVLDETGGLPNDFCSVLYADSLNTIWAGTNEGLCKISADDFKVTTYYFLNEFISDRINDIKRSGNYLYVANIRGVFVFDISEMEKKNENLAVPVFIRNVSTKNNLHIEQNSVLNYAENFIHISFTGLSYSSIGGLRYAYKLEGLETEWHYTKNLSLDYFNLPPGNYRFIIKAIAGNNHESIRPGIFSFTIFPPFWKTNWFIILLSIIICSLVYFVFRYRLGQVKSKADIKIFMAELEARSLRSQMNPHFIFNALNSIQNFVMKNDKNSAQAYLSKFARLIRNILEFSQIDFILLRNEIETLSLYIELEKLRASDKFKYSVLVDDSISADSIYIPAMLIQPVVENSILHGLLPMEKENGIMKISFAKKDAIISCTVEDNGIGRVKAKELNSTKQKQHRSMGTSIINERLDILEKTHGLDATCVVEDLYDQQSLPCGTKVTLTFPFKNKPK